ncbi:MAG: RecQ family ATP-dependent DNA helicase [Chitinophagaceae bacterium]|nr:RecQ family ATP-dependent DNA helicase [Chitinophagaceae bacterium]
MTPLSVLKKYWQYPSFRGNQEEVIKAVLAKKDTLAIMPTGGGKSICYQVPAMMASGLCLVVTPLIALMKDQVSNLKGRGIFSLAIHSGMKFHEVKRTLENAVHGNFKFLYVSPERLETSLFLEYLPSININLIAVDEAHCISQWGYDFRPPYLRIAAIREILSGVPIIAVTASATSEVQNDIIEKLSFRKGHELFLQTYERPNLSYSVFVPPSKENKLLSILEKVPGSSIVYCKSRKTTREVANLLRLNNINSDFYHAGLSTEERNRKQEEWIQNKTRVICCTNAFGMGIDKPDVRTVIHFDIPEALEYYYQEAGRVGRDGLKSYAVLLYHLSEITNFEEKVALRFPDIKTVKNIYNLLCNFLQLPAGKGEGLLFDFEISEFVERNQVNPILAVNTLKILEQEEILQFNEQFFSPATVEFITAKSSLEDFKVSFPQYSPIITGLLRSYEGILDQPAYIDEFLLARFIHTSKEDVLQKLKELHNYKIIDYTPRKDQPQIYFPKNRVRTDELFINQQNIAKRKKAYVERLEKMVEYADQKEVCRSVFINSYFTGERGKPCGICDVCLSKKQKNLGAKEFESVEKILSESVAVTTDEIHQRTGIPIDKILTVIQFLKDEEEIIFDSFGKISKRN